MSYGINIVQFVRFLIYIFTVAGLENFIREIGSTVSEEIEVQLSVYERLKSGDLDELSCKWNRIQTDFSDSDSAFQVCIYS